MPSSKSRTVFVCEDCGAQSAKWGGRCSQCGEWNTLTETLIRPSSFKKSTSNVASIPEKLSDLTVGSEVRIELPFKELNRLLGGGLVRGSVVLMSGEPGIGKSTLLLQILSGIATQTEIVLYVSGEESSSQVSMRAERLKAGGDSLYFLSETELDQIISHLDELSPAAVVVDSIQTIHSADISSAAGSVAQVRECTGLIIHWAKSKGVPVIIAGQVTKDGTVAGPRALEHLVDVVLNLEGDSLGVYRILRSTKNRFGSTNEIAVFQMGEHGLEEALEPSVLFLTGRPFNVPGSVITVAMEGSRPLLVEVQALTNTTVFAQPRRTATGIDIQRLLLIAAASAKRLGIPLGNQDIIVNVPGGLRVAEPASDLSVALALISSYRNVAVDSQLVALGEVGLGGELRAVPHIEKRLAEAARLGFKSAIVPLVQAEEIEISGIDVIGSSTLGEVLGKVFPRNARQAERSGENREVMYDISL